MHVAAEGVETAGELVRLRAAGCAIGLGHYVAPALPSNEMGDLLGAEVAFDVVPNVVAVTPRFQHGEPTHRRRGQIGPKY